MKRLALIGVVLISLLSVPSFGQHGYAYFYFEGDQQTPFYVKVEGQMQPRYGQNHFIIPDLGEGYTHFEILFQQNEYPPQEFLLDVPDGGFRGFALRKVNDQQFALYDLQQKKYILAGNKKEDDVAPKFDEIPVAQPSLAPKRKKNRIGTREVLPLLNGDTTIVLPENNAKDTTPLDTEATFMKGVVLNGGKTSPESDIKRDAGSLPLVANTDCPNAMSNEDFENFALKLLNKEEDESRLKFLKKETDNYCFSTEQVRIIAKNLKGQSARYEAVKMLYSHTSDQKNYGKLESLFNTPFLKEKFAQIINPK